MIAIRPELADDGLLLKQVQQSNKKAFDQLYEKYWLTSYSDAYRRLKDSDQAKDIVQDIFVYIWLNRETIRIHNFPAYLNTAIRNRIFKAVAKQKSSHPYFTFLESLPQKNDCADSDILRKEFFNAYEALINTLPKQRQIIFRLRIHEELATKDIAMQLRLSRKTVQNQLGKAIEQLRLSLAHLLTMLVIML